MPDRDIAWRRLVSQRLTGAALKSPADAVKWLVAVQSQDYPSACWGLGIRLEGASHESVERAYDRGAILRTHVLRPTWHFVTPADIRWLLMLTAPRIQRSNAGVCRRIGLDAATLARSTAVLAKALGHNPLTREEIHAVLGKSGIATRGGHKMSYILMHAELEAVICSGPRRGRQPTWALLDERAPAARTLSRDAALSELALRYARSRGPATVQDFARWSGLTVADAKAGMESVAHRLEHETINGRTYWFSSDGAAAKAAGAHLLSIYDEYISAYRDRSAIGSPKSARLLQSMGQALTHIVVVDGMVIGTWKRDIGDEVVTVKLDLFYRLTKTQTAALKAAVRRLGEFLGRKPVLR